MSGADSNGRAPSLSLIETPNGNGNGNGHVTVETPDGVILERRDPTRRVTVTVIVPTLNEARNLPHVLPRIPVWVDEVLLVDGGSEDGTVEIAKRLVPGIRVIGQERPGKGAALQAGFRAATGDIIVTLDADGSADPVELPAFIGCLLAGADFVKGSRFMQGGGTDDMEALRKAGNWALRTLVRVTFGGRYTDLCYGYNAFWRRLAPIIDGDADGFEIETLMNIRVLAAGLKVAEVPSFEARRIHGLSNLNTWSDGYRVLRTILRERRQVQGRNGHAPVRGRLSNGSPVAAALAQHAPAALPEPQPDAAS